HEFCGDLVHERGLHCLPATIVGGRPAVVGDRSDVAEADVDVVECGSGRAGRGGFLVPAVGAQCCASPPPPSQSTPSPVDPADPYGCPLPTSADSLRSPLGGQVAFNPSGRRGHAPVGAHPTPPGTALEAASSRPLAPSRNRSRRG